MLGSLILIVIGASPQPRPGLYFLAVTLWLLETGFTLLWLVWTRNTATRPAT